MLCLATTATTGNYPSSSPTSHLPQSNPNQNHLQIPPISLKPRISIPSCLHSPTIKTPSISPDQGALSATSTIFTFNPSTNHPNHQKYHHNSPHFQPHSLISDPKSASKPTHITTKQQQRHHNPKTRNPFTNPLTCNRTNKQQNPNKLTPYKPQISQITATATPQAKQITQKKTKKKKRKERKSKVEPKARVAAKRKKERREGYRRRRQWWLRGGGKEKKRKEKKETRKQERRRKKKKKKKS